jgi:ribonuclease inhibitor
MNTITIDCAEVTTEADFWELYLKCTNPVHGDYFGRNLDAFWDALAGGPGFPGEVALAFINTKSIRDIRDGAFYAALKDIASDCETVPIAVE